MDKKPLIVVSICAVVLLLMGSLSNVTGYQTMYITEGNDSSQSNISIGNINNSDSIPSLVGIPTDWWPMFRHDLTNSGSTTSSAPETPDILWTYDTNHSVHSSPVVVNGKLFICSYGGLYCIDANSGIKLWKYSTGLTWEVGTPAIADSKVYFGSANGSLYCLEEDTGALLWNYTMGYSVEHASPSIAGGNVYLLTWNGELWCINAKTGAKIWSNDFGGSSDSTAAIVNGKIYIGIGYKVFCLNADTGATFWSYATNNSVMSSPAIINGKVYVGSMDSNVYCLNADTGAKLWVHPTAGGIGQSSPAVANGKVYIGSTGHIIYCFDAETGSLVWSHATGESVGSSPVVADGNVYFGSFDQRVYCYDANTGSLLWSYMTGSGVMSSPAVAGGRLYIASTDGIIYTFGKVNHPPLTPTITGPIKGNVVVAYQYNFTTTDPEGDLVNYFIDWGDGINSSWIGPYTSEAEITKEHTWSKKGTYIIKVKAKDIYDFESEWGYLEVTMPYAYNLASMQFWDRLFQRFPYAFPILRHFMGY